MDNDISLIERTNSDTSIEKTSLLTTSENRILLLVFRVSTQILSLVFIGITLLWPSEIVTINALDFKTTHIFYPYNHIQVFSENGIESDQTRSSFSFIQIIIFLPTYIGLYLSSGFILDSFRSDGYDRLLATEGLTPFVDFSKSMIFVVVVQLIFLFLIRESYNTDDGIDIQSNFMAYWFLLMNFIVLLGFSLWFSRRS